MAQDVEGSVWRALDHLKIELPSWGFANTGTRFGKFMQPAAATNLAEKFSDAGMVKVNLSTAGVDFHVPFGGRKGSSYGPREQGSYAREFFTQVKTSYELPL